jgi:hypothetical protein
LYLTVTLIPLAAGVTTSEGEGPPRWFTTRYVSFAVAGLGGAGTKKL